MFKRIVLMLMALACVLLLCSCQKQEAPTKRYDVVTNPDNMGVQQVQMTAVPTNTPAPVVTDVPVQQAANQGLSTTPTKAPIITSPYAGATPVAIDPIDKPTPTPLPQLPVPNYAVYDATKLHLSFKAPAGWEENTSVPNTYMIYSQPVGMDCPVSLTLSVRTVSQTLDAKGMQQEVADMLTTLKNTYKSLKHRKVSDRTLLDKEGWYNDYTATMADGTQVAGRVQVTCIGKTVYMVHVSYPEGYTEFYKKNLYNVFQSSVKISQ